MDQLSICIGNAEQQGLDSEAEITKYCQTEVEELENVLPNLARILIFQAIQEQ